MQNTPATPAEAEAEALAKITRADAVALWHAVDALKYSVRAMRGMPDMAEHLPTEEARHAAAQVALRKVQALVRASKKPATLRPVQ